ncbi:MAG: Ppx/GppA family phosphatase [Candidatus Accumulibacter sp.]|jgi:exopolyphosphatase/guanosine-5'-triphosphate,3'-diphosphate pyrophosphatase|nr:Ppx/GppA family phosphatase [Accumulibacter sp.]
MGYEQIAAVDLGSNSFRLEVGRVVGRQIYSLDSLKETVRLASGLTRQRLLCDDAQQRGLETLGRFAERLRGFAPEAVRAVATNTLRVARNAGQFIRKAEAVLGFPIEVIGGREEARLIYVGVARAAPPGRGKRLVADIGGGSTEIVIGRKLEPLLMESLFMGCVSYSMRFFPGGGVDKKRFAEAELAAGREIEAFAQNFRSLGWDEAVASSGTAKAAADILEINGMNPERAPGISRAGLEKLKARLIRAGSAGALGLEGLRPDREPVFAGGLAILCAIFSALDLAHMSYAEGALRLGVLYELLGRFHQLDMRDSTVRQFMKRYQVDARQAGRVEATALELLGQLIPVGEARYENETRALRWAAALHEIGISIAHNGFHKHGAYIVASADMPGFSKKDQETLSLLVLGQRGKLEKLPPIPPGDPLWRQIFCLRLAALLHRPRGDEPLPPVKAAQSPQGFQAELPAAWLQKNPLTAGALAEEAAAWGGVGWQWRVRRRAAPGVSEAHG